MKYKNCAFGKKKLRRKDKMQKILSLSSKNIRSVKKTNRCVVIVRNCKLCTIVKSCRLNFYPVKNCCEIFPSLYYQIIIISTMYKNKIRIFFFPFLFSLKLLFFSLSTTPRHAQVFGSKPIELKIARRNCNLTTSYRRSIRLENHRDNHSV